jgi:hypothetical protein
MEAEINNQEIEGAGDTLGKADNEQEQEQETVETNTEGGEQTEVVEEEAKPALNFDSFDQLRNDTKSALEKPKVEDAKEETKIVEADTKVVQGAAKKEVKPRDLSDIEEADRPLFKQMSNEAFNKFKPMYLAHKQAGDKKTTEQVPLYAHPKAYLLDEKHEQLQYKSSIIEQIHDHWKRQEMNIKKNGKIIDVEMDDKGKLVYKAERDATDEDEIQVSKLVVNSGRKYAEANAEYENFVKGYGKSLEQDIQTLNKQTEEFFPEFDKEDHPTKPLQQKIIEALPPSQRSSPLAPLVAKVASALALVQAENKKLKADAQKKVSIAKDVAAAPIKRTGNFVAPNAGTKANGKQYTMDDFDRAREGKI